MSCNFTVQAFDPKEAAAMRRCDAIAAFLSRTAVRLRRRPQ
jgi:hypothetical protein